MILILRKARSLRVPNPGCSEAESPAWLDVLPKNSAWDMMHEWVCCRDEAANHQLPIAVAFWIIWSFHRGMFKLHARFDANSLLYLLSHFECDGHTVHMFTQWHLPSPLTSTVNLSLFTHVHSSLLSLDARLYQCHTNHSCYSNKWLDSLWTDLVYCAI